jgi:hypothetical protein
MGSRNGNRLLSFSRFPEHQVILELPANITQLDLMFSKRCVVAGLLFPILKKGTTIQNIGKPLSLPVLNARSTINPDL